MSNQEELYKHSKKLIAISFSIIVFVLGGGQFKQQPEYFGGTVVFDNIFVIPITVVIVFLFYWYRFWVFQRNPIEYSRNMIFTALRDDDRFREYVREKAKEEINRRLENSIEICGQNWNSEDEEKPVRGEYRYQDHKESGLFSKKIPVSIVDTSGSGIGIMDVKLGLFRFFHFARVKTFSSYISTNYSYRVLPNWLAILATICILYVSVEYLLEFLQN